MKNCLSKRIIFNIGILLTLGFICACTNKSENKKMNSFPVGIHVDTIFYPNGKIHVIEKYRDTTRNGLYLEYYEDGKLSKKYNFINGKSTGVGYEYYENGFKREEGYFKNGLRDSIQIHYDENGNMDEKYFAFKNLTFGEMLKYYPSGKLKEYRFYDHKGRARYSALYDDAGKLTKEEGNPFAEYFVVLPDSASADVGDTMKAIIFCATPPDCKVTLDFNEQNNLIPSSNLTNQIKDNYAYVVYKLNKKGIYNTAVTLQIYNGTIRESKTFYKKFSFVVN